MKKSFFAASALLLSPVFLSPMAAQAATLADVDFSQLAFDLQTETPVGGSVATYTGVSGTSGSTVGFTVDAFSPLSDLTSTNDFSTMGFPGQLYENVHVHGFTINFDSAISSLLVLAENDNGPVGSGRVQVDLGFEAADTAGVVDLIGTSYAVDTANMSTYLLYKFASPVTSISNIAGPGTDGFEMAFFANVAPLSADPVPVPAALPLMAFGLAGIGALRRRARSQ
ncbi:MAG: VPLPA-CTERM sorting domain-containing protein [Pseudomonadota bacterium]